MMNETSMQIIGFGPEKNVYIYQYTATSGRKKKKEIQQFDSYRLDYEYVSKDMSL